MEPMILLALFLTALLIFVASIRPARSSYTAFELARMRKTDASSDIGIRREDNYLDVRSILGILVGFLLVSVSAAYVAALGWVIGILVALLVALGYGVVARQRVIAVRTQALYERYETKIFDVIEPRRSMLTYIRWASQDNANQYAVSSVDELVDLLDRSPVISKSDRVTIEHYLSFGERTVGEIMTPRSVMTTIQQDEILGPLVLDDLHKTGHSRFPVIGTDLDHIVGMLYVHDILVIDGTKKKTAKVSDSMSKKVFFVHESQTLTTALAAFISTHHHLFVVINEYRETVGLLSLEDVMEAMLGRAIVDEHDQHDDLRSVAKRHSSERNVTKDSTDV